MASVRATAFGGQGGKSARSSERLPFWERLSAALTGSAEERRRQAPTRFFVLAVMGAVTAGALNIVGVREWLWAWTFGNFAAQSIEIAVLWRFRPGRAPVDPISVSAGLVVTGLVSLAYGIGALIVWRMPGQLGPAAAVIMLCGALMNVTALSRRSALLFFAAAAPHAAVLVAGPILAKAPLAGDPMYPVIVFATLTLVLALVTVWRRGERVRRAEEAALLLAEQRRAEAETATEAKTRYAAAVSHEMRTPLTAILAVAAEGERRAATDWGKESSMLVGDAARMMRRLLDDLLDLAKIEAGHMGVEATPFSPRALLEDVRRFWAAEAAGAHVALVLEGADAAPARAVGDPTRLRQILNNLVSNALKFTPQGEIHITATAEPLPDRGVRLSVTVADTGQGIPADQLERLFTPFHQAHEASFGAGGTGLGLAISRELARLMGGDVTAASSPKGSRFTVSVVLAAAEARSPSEALRPEPAGALAGMRLLVVDDQPLVRKAMGILLEPLGAVTEYAGGGTDALDRLGREPFDLILMDVNMADLDGLETARRLRASAGPNRATPILAVTGATHAATEAVYRASGMNGVIAKPLEPRPFYAALESALERAEAA